MYCIYSLPPGLDELQPKSPASPGGKESKLKI